MRAARTWTTRMPALTALAAYLAISFLYFGVRLLVEHGGQYVGTYDDPQISVWLFKWWPHEILHGRNPFVAHVDWPPEGVNLAWVVSVPALAIAFSPVTLLFGPVAAYNAAAIAMPALSAWAAFLLCRRLTRSWWPSLVGGYLFGFSTYVIGHMTGQLHITGVFVVPLLALAFLRYLDGELSRLRLALAIGALVALELYLSTELTFTLTMTAAATLVLAFLVAPERRRALLAAVPAAVGGFLLGLVLAAPIVYYALTSVRISSLQNPNDYVVDALNLVAPTSAETGGAGPLRAVSKHIAGNIAEQGAVVGIPLLVVIVLFARRRWRTSAGRFLLLALGLAVYASLGPELVVAGHRLLPLPTPFGHETVTLPGIGTKFLPVLNNVLPVRFEMYASLAAAVIVALWLSTQRGRLAWLLPALAVLLIVPNPAAGLWATTYHVPPFFTDPAYRSCLEPNEIVLPQPVRGGGPSMLWQEAAGFRFRMTGGRLQTSAPSPYLHPASIAAVAVGNGVTPDWTRLLRAYFAAKHVTTVLVDKAHAEPWASQLDRIAKRQDVGGVLLYRVGASGPRPCRPT